MYQSAHKTLGLVVLLAVYMVAASQAACLSQQQVQTAQTVIVLDFTNRSGQPSTDLLARLATDRVAVELANSGKYEVLKRAEVERTAKELNLKPPYDFIGKSKLASTLGASTIVEGSIDFVKEAVKRGDKKGLKAIQVGLKVRVIEASSGELIGGAAAVGEAEARVIRTSSRDVAVKDAAQVASSMLHGKKPIEGALISFVGFNPRNQVLINRGERDGVRVGMRFAVSRDGEKIGIIRATNIFATDSEAEKVEEKRLMRGEDRVREIVEEPHFPPEFQMFVPLKRMQLN